MLVFFKQFHVPQIQQSKLQKTMANPSLQLPSFPLLFTLFLLTTRPNPAHSIPTLTQLRTLLSLSHSLSSRVATLRASRGDTEGARRAQLIASKLDFGLGIGLWPSFWSMGWDYIRNYAWRDTMSFRDGVGIVGDLSQLVGSLGELGRLRSDSDRVQWVAKNYGFVLRKSKSVFSRALAVFTKSGPLRELVETLQKEMEGDFLKDLLEVGGNDLKGVAEILKNLASQYTHVDDHQEL